jgi:Rps23 Pro-64 3,4-dihydroxylase Tpa1-like proline 4-hydroxylase
MIVQPLDRDLLRRQYVSARPFPFVKIENFLEPSFAAAVAAAYPTFEDGQRQGMTFKAVNELKKVQITDSKLFPDSVARLNEALAAPEFLSDLSYITGIADLLADEELIGGGIHITGPGGRLDVHVDFNYLESRKLHRRINILLYLNPVWEEQWGGHIQLWDKDVKACWHSFAPLFNRCVIFETNEISFHGVTPVTTASPHPRISFAGYYYTREAPANYDGGVHSTIFKARPDERLRGYVLMPAESLQRRVASGVDKLRQHVKRLLNSAST